MATRPTSILATMMLVLSAGTGCGSDPENPGDECDPDDGCPNGMICAAGEDDEDICYTPLGGECEVGGPDYCHEDAICAADEEGKGHCGTPEGGNCDPANEHCAGTMVCAELVAGGHACYPPVFARGMVFDAASEAAIAGAHVLALDDQATAITGIAISGPDGNYELQVPIPRKEDGAPTDEFAFTLRASAQDYQTFPGGLRTSLPISAGEAASVEKGWDIDVTLTDIALIALPADEKGQASISGKVLSAEGAAGVLVVAEGGERGISAVSDLDGDYTIFNVPDGSYTVQGYAAGLQLNTASASVAGAPLTGVDLTASAEALGRITGSVNIVNAPGGSVTSVVLVVKSTFSETFVRGEVPRGLRTPLSGPPDVTGAFTIDNVPAGEYVVLAAFENDDLVRDPDPNIAGTQIVNVTMTAPGEDIALETSFKVTEALAVIGPGVDQPEAVSAPVTLRWADDSSEDFYTVVVYNAYGELVWCASDAMMAIACEPNITGVSGSDEVSIEYGGPLEAGMYYQFRATSWRIPGGEPGPISQTEDLRGVFFVEGGE
jgi:hypothetical protein